MYGSAGNIEMLSTKEYFTFKGLLPHKDDKEVFALARLTFYENLFIGQVSVVWIKHVGIDSLETKKN